MSVEQNDANAAPDLAEADAQLDAAFDWLDETSVTLHERNIGQFERYDLDLAVGRITFSGGETPPLAFACQAVGTFHTEKGTWHWGWDHPSIPVEVAYASETVRQFGERYELGAFTKRQIEATEQDAWQFTGLAGMLTNAIGTYRCPGTAAVYLVLYEIE